MDPTNATITLTFGDQAENHVGMEQLGQKVAPGMGFNLQDFQDIEKTFMAMDVTCLLHDLGDGAYLLVLKQAVDALLKSSGKTKEDLWEEQCALQVDKKALMYGRVVDKHARWNLCFDDHSQEPDIENGKGRVIALSATPVTSAIVSQFESVFGPKAQNLKGEGNYYYDITKCGIGTFCCWPNKPVLRLMHAILNILLAAEKMWLTTSCFQAIMVTQKEERFWRFVWGLAIPFTSSGSKTASPSEITWYLSSKEVTCTL